MSLFPQSDREDAVASAPGFRPLPTGARWLLLLAAAGLPLSLLWDFSWESTIGIDLVGSPPHVATYLAVALAAGAALGVLFLPGNASAGGTLGARVVLWGACAFGAAFLFDRWWQASYGLAAGIWHPPQLLKAAAFLAITFGAWVSGTGLRAGFAASGGVVLALTFLFTLAGNFANRQHSATFYQIACGAYPVVLVALALAGRGRWTATPGALAGMLLVAAMVWLLPLVPGSPQVAPIYHPRDYLLPPPFPLLLVAPALALDALLRVFPKKGATRAPGWGQAIEAGLAFFAVFLAVQWPFARFLLSPAADHWFFAGGGKHWPFFQRLAPSAETAFWTATGDEMNLRNTLLAAGLAIVSARLGLWLGAWLQRVRR